MIRFILTLIALIIILILSLIALPIEWLIGKISINAKNKSSRKIVQFIFHIFKFTTGTKLTVIGKEKIPKDKAVLYVGNHRGIFDIILTYINMPGITGYVAKEKLNRFPLFAHWMRNIKCLFLDRDDARQGLKTILKGVEYIKSGISIAIFPEGTRSKTDLEMLPFKEGSFKLATKTKCPIVPLAINNTSAILEDQFPRIKKSHIIIEFCDPIYIENMSIEEIKNLPYKTQDIIKETVAKNYKNL